MAASTVPTVKAALITLFTTANPNVPVDWAAPAEDDRYGEDNIWLGDVEQEEDFKVLGRQRIDEEFTLDFWVQTVRQGNDPQDAEEAAWTLREACVTAIRSDLTLGGIVNQWVGPHPTRMEVRPLPNGWLAKGRVALTCRARI